MPGIDETENHFRVRLRDPDQFTRLRIIPFKRTKPRINAVVGRLRGETTTTLQSLLFPKEDGWTRASVSEWMREHPDVGKAEAIDEVAAKDLAIAGVLPEMKAPDEWAQLTKSIPVPGGIIRKTYPVLTKAVDEEDHEVDVVISTSAVDRDREVVRPEGMKVFKPKRIPLVASHAYGDLRKHIGEILKAKPEGEEIPARARYFAEMGNAEADWGWTLVKLGVAAYSIGFRPFKWEDADLDDEKVLEQVRAGKKPLRTFTEWELVETSHVIVPSQREAVQREVAEAVTKGVIDQDLADRISRALEGDGKSEPSPAPMDALLAEILGEGAGDEAAAHYAIGSKQGERWIVGGARGLPLLDDDSWDAAAALAAWRRFTGAANQEALGERATQRRYRRGFVVYNAAAPDDFGSYKVPFAKIEGGRAKASRRGLAAARGVLAGGRFALALPGPAKAAAERLVNGYLGRQEEDGKETFPIPRAALVRLFGEEGPDVVVIEDEDGQPAFRGAPVELVDALERAAGAPLEVRQTVTLTVPPVELKADGLEAWTERFIDKFVEKFKAAVAEAAPKAPGVPADSVADILTPQGSKELAEIIVSTALKIARAEIGKAAGDVDAYRQ